jgi:hypothetical protein
MPLTVTVNAIAECLRTDCNILGDSKKIKNLRGIMNAFFVQCSFFVGVMHLPFTILQALGVQLKQVIILKHR